MGCAGEMSTWTLRGAAWASKGRLGIFCMYVIGKTVAWMRLPLEDGAQGELWTKDQTVINITNNKRFIVS